MHIGFLRKKSTAVMVLAGLLMLSVLLSGCSFFPFGGGQTQQATQAPTDAPQTTAAEITKITLDKQTAALYVGKTIQLTAKYTPTDAAETALSWSSSDDTVALVNSEGYVTGVSAGYANIICRASNGIEASCTVTVKADEDAKKDDSSDSKADSAGSNTTVIYYGHYYPGYVYNASDFVFPESSVRKLTASEISATLNAMKGSSVSGSFAQDAINEIYARNGYIFKDAGIRAYYESKPWYYEDASFTTGDFNDVERYNISLLTNY